MKRFITEKLCNWKRSKKRKPLLLLGVRQVGKTYILQDFASQHYAHFHYINFEKAPGLSKIFEVDLDPGRIINELSFYLNHPINIGEDLVIFDEIQECPKALTSLKYFQEEMPQLQLCGAGSFLGIHLAYSSFPVGKVDMLTLRPMSFEEFLMADQDHRSLEVLHQAADGSEISEIAHLHLWSQLKHYFIVGGMPEAVEIYCEHKKDPFTAFALVRKKQEELVTAYYADMAKHSGKVNAMHLDRVFHSVPIQLKQELNGGARKFQFKGVIPGVSHYQRMVQAIDWLEAAGLIIKIHIVNRAELPLQAYAKENRFKLLLFDVGILGAMGGLSPKAILNYDYGSYKGYFAENYVAQAFLCAGEKELFCWSEKSAEVEFIIEEEGELIPVEVKAGGSLRSKSLGVFAEKYKPPYRILLSAKPMNLNGTHGLCQLPLYLAGSVVGS